MTTRQELSDQFDTLAATVLIIKRERDKLLGMMREAQFIVRATWPTEARPRPDGWLARVDALLESIDSHWGASDGQPTG